MFGSSLTPELQDPYKRTQDPYVTGASTIAFKTNDFVIMAADTLASYGRMARLFDFERIKRIGEKTIYAASGEMSDLQEVQSILEQEERDDKLQNDGDIRGPSQWHTLLTRMCYQRRNKMDPFYNTFLVGGIENGDTYLGFTDLLGTHFTDDYVASGFGQHLCLPLLRRLYKADMTEDEAVELINQCIKVLYYRECRTTNTFSITIMHRETGYSTQNVKANTDWTVSKSVKGYDGQQADVSLAQ